MIVHQTNFHRIAISSRTVLGGVIFEKMYLRNFFAMCLKAQRDNYTSYSNLLRKREVVGKRTPPPPLGKRAAASCPRVEKGQPRLSIQSRADPSFECGLPPSSRGPIYLPLFSFGVGEKERGKEPLLQQIKNQNSEASEDHFDLCSQRWYRTTAWRGLTSSLCLGLLDSDIVR